MKIALFLNSTLIFLLFLCVSKKRLHMFANIFTFMILEFLITTYFSILNVNYHLFKFPNRDDLYFIIRVFEVILLPALFIWYFNVMSSLKTRFFKIALTILLFTIFNGLDYLFVHWKVIKFLNWHYWKTLVSLLAILLITFWLQQWFRMILRKEGIKDG